MVIVYAVSDGYYLPAPLTLLYVSRLLSRSCPSFSFFFSLIHTISHSVLLALSSALVCCIHVHSLSIALPYYLTVLIFFTFLVFLLTAFTLCLLLPTIFLWLSLLHRCKYNNLIHKAAKKAARGKSIT